LVASLAVLVAKNVYATSPDDELLKPRDLDGDTTTIEAYYDAKQNLTWLADTNPGKSQTFGLQRGAFTDSSLEINSLGEMREPALESYLSGMNQSVYLGLSNWRLPVAQARGDFDCSVQSNGYSVGVGCSGAEIPSLMQRLLGRYGSVANSPFKNLNNSPVWLGSQGGCWPSQISVHW